MKRIIIIPLLLLTFTLAGQDKEQIHLESSYVDGKVRLIWMVEDQQVWDWARNNGYTLKRRTKATNGQELSSVDYAASEVVLAEQILPLSENEIETQYPDNDLAQAAKYMMYNPEAADHTVDGSKVTLADVVQAVNKQETQVAFSQMFGAMDYETAVITGQAFIDENVSSNNIYVYFLSLTKPLIAPEKQIDLQDFESDLGEWVDGGTDCGRTQNAVLAQSGEYSLFIRNSGESANATKMFNTTGITAMSFHFLARPTACEAGDAFAIQLSSDGQNFETIKTYEYGVDFENVVIMHESITIMPNADETYIRLQMLADHVNDRIYFDDLSLREDGGFISDNDFEEGMGSWIDGGVHCLRFSNATFSQSGTHSVIIRNSGPTANFTQAVDVSQYEKIQLSFAAFPWSCEAGDAFEVQFSLDGSTFYPYKRYEYDTDFENGSVLDEVLDLDVRGDLIHIRFQMDADHNTDRIFVDDVKLTGIHKDHSVVTRIHTDSNLSLPALSITDSRGGDHVAELTWTLDVPAEEYVYFDIERADVSQSPLDWQKVNDLPYIYMKDSKLKELNSVTYVDDLPDNITTFAYRVCGKSPYGILSPPSDTVHVKGIGPRMEIELDIDSFEYLVNANDVILRWPALPATAEAQIDRYDVYRAAEYTGPFLQINQSALHNTTYTYNDNSPLSSNYYKLEATDVNGHKYESLIRFYQLADSTAPADPVITEVKFISDDEVLVSWDHVDDSDLNGYRLCISNKEQGNYIQNNNELIKTNSYKFSVSKETEIDSLYVCISSEDHHQNLSQGSVPVGITRPDLHGPSDPVLSSVSAAPDGIHLIWKWSSSEDVSQHVLQRRALSGPSWIDVLTITPEQKSDYNTSGEGPSYVDSSYVEIQEYQYRLVAQDNSDHITSSKLFSTRPYTPQVTGNVSSVTLEEDSNPAFRPAIVDRVMGDLQKIGARPILRSSETQTKHDLTLGWVYPLTANVREFQIYRSMSGGTMELYKTVSLSKSMGLSDYETVEVTAPVGNQSFSFTDENLTPNRRYTYQVKTVHMDGSVSNRSGKVSKLIN